MNIHFFTYKGLDLFLGRLTLKYSAVSPSVHLTEAHPRIHLTPKGGSWHLSRTAVDEIIELDLTLKYLTVLTLSSMVASSSQSMRVRGCCWKADTVHMWFTPSSIAMCNARALWDPVISTITCPGNGRVRAPEREMTGLGQHLQICKNRTRTTMCVFNGGQQFHRYYAHKGKQSAVRPTHLLGIHDRPHSNSEAHPPSWHPWPSLRQQWGPPTSLASMTVPTPTVRDCLGTRLRSWPKKRALAKMVSWLRVLTRVRDTRDDPGSLKAMWPSGPIPVTTTAILL